MQTLPYYTFYVVLQAQSEDLRQELHSFKVSARSSQNDCAQLERQLEDAQEQRTQLQEQLHEAQALTSQLQLHQTQTQSSQHQQELHHVSQLESFELGPQLSEATARVQTTSGELASSEAAQSDQRGQGTGLQSQLSARQQQGTFKLQQQNSGKRWEKRLSSGQQSWEEEGAEGQLPEEEEGREVGAVGPIVDKLWNDLQQERVRHALSPLPHPAPPLHASCTAHHPPYTSPNLYFTKPRPLGHLPTTVCFLSTFYTFCCCLKCWLSQLQHSSMTLTELCCCFHLVSYHVPTRSLEVCALHNSCVASQSTHHR